MTRGDPHKESERGILLTLLGQVGRHRVVPKPDTTTRISRTLKKTEKEVLAKESLRRAEHREVPESSRASRLREHGILKKGEPKEVLKGKGRDPWRK